MEFLKKYATPLSMVTSIAVSVTGLMLLFGIRGPIGDVHEWIGVAFVAAMVMHIVRNWPGIKKIMSSLPGMAIVGGFGIAFAVLIVMAMPSGSGEHGGHGGGPWMVANRVADAPISVSAPALGLTADQAVTKLKAAGVPVDGPQDSLSHLARDHEQPLPRLFGVLIKQ
jgi:hypothetical protein